jgi:uncharacterized protein YoxC
MIGRKPSVRTLILTLTRKVDKMAATVEEVLASLTTLTTDLEGLASTAKTEFAKLEEEVAAGKPAELGPVKEAIDAIDSKVKSAVVPTA